MLVLSRRAPLRPPPPSALRLCAALPRLLEGLSARPDARAPCGGRGCPKRRLNDRGATAAASRTKNLRTPPPQTPSSVKRRGSVSLPRRQAEPSGRKRSGTAHGRPDGPSRQYRPRHCTPRWRRPRRRAWGGRGERAVVRPPQPSPWSGLSRSPTCRTWRPPTAGCVRRRCVWGRAPWGRGAPGGRRLRRGGLGRSGTRHPGGVGCSSPLRPAAVVTRRAGTSLPTAFLVVRIPCRGIKYGPDVGGMVPPPRSRCPRTVSSLQIQSPPALRARPGEEFVGYLT